GATGGWVRGPPPGASPGSDPADGHHLAHLRPVATPDVAEPVAEAAVVAVERVASQRHGHDLVDLGRAGQVRGEGLVYGVAAQPAGVFLCQHSAADLVATVAVGPAGVTHRT